jgi:hypothetical protein
VGTPSGDSTIALITLRPLAPLEWDPTDPKLFDLERSVSVRLVPSMGQYTNGYSALLAPHAAKTAAPTPSGVTASDSSKP